MHKTTLLSLTAALAASTVLCEASRAAVHSPPDPANALEQRIQAPTEATSALAHRLTSGAMPGFRPSLSRPGPPA